MKHTMAAGVGRDRFRRSVRPGSTLASGLALIVSLMSVASLVAQATAQADVYRALSDRLVAEAQAIALNEPVSATALLERAVAIDPANPRAQRSLATLLRPDRRSTREVERRLVYALDHTIDSTERLETAGELAELLLRTRRPAEARDLLVAVFASIPPGEELPHHLLEWVAAPDRMRPALVAGSLSVTDHRYLEAVVASDAPWFSADLIERLRTAVPRDARLAALDWGARGRSPLEMFEWFTAFVAEPFARADAVALQRALLGRLISGQPAATAATLVSAYRSIGGSDPIAAVVQGAHDSRALSGAALDALRSGDKAAWEVADRYGVEIPAATVAASVDGEIEMALDADRDGFDEAHYRYRDGALVAWRQDADQDGITEAAIWGGSRPTHLALRDGDTVVWLLLSPTGALIEVRRLTVVAEPTAIPLRVRELIDGRDSRRWLAATPLPIESPFSWPVVASEHDWSPFARRATLKPGVPEMFVRQLASDDAVVVAQTDLDSYSTDLRAWGFLE